MENNQNEQELPPQEEVVAAPSEEQAVDQSAVPQDRPERNWKAELERKTRELEKLRQELESKAHVTPTRDPNDIRTWSDNELKAVMNSNDPTVLPYKDQVSDELLERKVRSIREKERAQEKRALSEMELRSKYPEAMDPMSEFALKMDQVMEQFDLQKSPAGRLAAAKLVAGELYKGSTSAEAQGRKRESDRVRDVRAQMVDGDRPRPTESDQPRKAEDVVRRVNSKNIDESTAAMSDLLRSKGFTSENFFKK